VRRTRAAAGVVAALLGLLAVGGTAPGHTAPAPRPTATPTPEPPLPGQGAGGAAIGGARLGTRGVVGPPGVPGLPRDLTAHGWLLADLDTGEVLAARDPHGRYPPASTLKMLTALTLLPRLPDKRKVVVCTAADVNVDGTRVGLVPNGHYTVDLLFQSMLMVSGNDAANALARAAGGVPRTLAAMNAEAKRLQALDTHAATPSGLDGPGQLTSAYDLALIARAALARPDFRHYVTQRKGRVPAQKPKWPAFEIANGNRLLYTYPGAFGVKNGFTDAARHTYVGAARRGGRRLIATFMFGEQTPIRMTEQAARLLDWGFRLPRTVHGVGVLVGPADSAGSPAPGATVSPGPTPGTSPVAAAPSGAGGSGRLPVLPLVGLGAAVVVAGAVALTLRRRS
jgi:D-alanyl-D-alanine carboxypeptidase (penicillin-binding protein 5/6)